MRKTFCKVLLGAFMLSAIAVACNNKKDKKEEPPKEDATKVEPVTQPIDTLKPATGDTPDTRPVKPGE